MKKYGHTLKPLNAEIKYLGTAYGEREETVRKIQKKFKK